MSTVFISYRREITAGEARALFNELLEKLGKNSVFMDVDSIALGRDFRSALQRTLESCDLMLVLIGRDWAEVKDEEGRTRLENPGDFVRLEIEAALERDIVVTPILVQGAHMPAPEQLPEEIRDLAYRHSFELSHNRWESDVREMIRRLGLEPPQMQGQTEEKKKSMRKNNYGYVCFGKSMQCPGILVEWHSMCPCIYAGACSCHPMTHLLSKCASHQHSAKRHKTCDTWQFCNS